MRLRERKREPKKKKRHKHNEVFIFAYTNRKVNRGIKKIHVRRLKMSASSLIN